ncbi:uncharacterized protein LOC128224508 [Mya arenaria]|uniref:uncharacterized protein LOC128224508 n=1 Tax=Mya arenaria TaxID=6604 RepID=UPI0022E58BE8|nr:uncharacterized protein LOC128224508 [Mya arenaria]
MDMYIIYMNKVKRTERIYLERCFLPSVGSHFEHRVDPALWFKVLALDRILVDCTACVVHWAPRGHVGDDKLREVANEGLTIDRVFESFRGTGCFSEDELDPVTSEAFALSREIAIKLDLKDLTKEENDRHHENIVRALHIYILPRVKLLTGYESCVKEALENITAEENNLGRLIKSQIKTKEGLKQTLWLSRVNMLQSNDLFRKGSLYSLDEHFLQTLLKHIIHDIEHIGMKIVQFEDEIFPLRHSEDENDIKKLEELREQRDQSHCRDTYTLVLTRREEIRDFLEKKDKEESDSHDSQCKLKRKGSKMHAEYVKMAVKLEIIEKEIDEMMTTKLKVSAVREAARVALKEIAETGESYGFVHKRSDVCHMKTADQTASPKHWKTLQDVINELISNTRPSEIRNEFLKCCHEIQFLCQDLNSTAQKTHTEVQPAMCQSTSVYVKEKLERMTRHLVASARSNLDFVPIHLDKNVYICFEVHAFSEIMPTLSRLHEYCYKQVCNELYSGLHHISDSNTTPYEPHTSTDAVEERTQTDRGREPQQISENQRECELVIVTIQSTQSLVQKMKLFIRMTELAAGELKGKQARDQEKNTILCADDFVDTLVAWIKDLSPKMLLILYSQLTLVENLCPDFLRNCHGEYSMVTLSVAFTHLMEICNLRKSVGQPIHKLYLRRSKNMRQSVI